MSRGKHEPGVELTHWLHAKVTAEEHAFVSRYGNVNFAIRALIELAMEREERAAKRKAKPSA